MIRIRNNDGSVTLVPNGRFVEIVNDKDGTVNMVCYQQDPHTVIQVPPGSREAARYMSLFQRFGLRFAGEIITRGPV